MRKYVSEAVIVAAGIVLMGIAISIGLKSVANKERVVNVKGLAEMEVAADKVTWPLVYKNIGNDLSVIYRDLQKTNDIITGYLLENGIEKSEITLGAPEIIDMKAERYSSNESPYRYNVTSVITVVSSKVELVRNLISEQSELLKKGVAITGGDYRYNVEYEFTSLNDVKPQMIEEATKNARKAAEKFAADSDSKLGKIKRAYQGQFSISDRDLNTPYIKKIRVVTTIDYLLKD